MNDHYHYVREIQGAAEESHSHTPREIGAAGDNDLSMLKRDVNAAEATIAVLERQNNRQNVQIEELKRQVRDLEGRLEYWTDAHGRLQQQCLQLGQTVEAIAAAQAAAGKEY